MSSCSRRERVLRSIWPLSQVPAHGAGGNPLFGWGLAAPTSTVARCSSRLRLLSPPARREAEKGMRHRPRTYVQATCRSKTQEKAPLKVARA